MKMGCDIHGWVELKHGGKWVAVSELTELGKARNYTRFEALAGVRAGPDCKIEPRGLPDDVSDTVRYHVYRWGRDAHSHSHLPLEYAAEIFRQTEWVPGPEDPPPSWRVSDAMRDPLYGYFNYSRAGGDQREARLVFWFDN
jgi:hypothetical protein